LVLETEQAYLNDIFVDIDFKLNTKLIDPVGTLKSASSLLEISSALTDEYGYIHPVEIIFYDKQGIIHKKSALANNGSQEDTISIIDFFEDFSNTDIYGEEGDNIHFYIDEGHVSLVSDAVFELDFDYNGELTEDTKIKKGDIKAFKFYLDSRAEFLTKLALDMSYAYEDGDEITLLNFKKATAHFVVPPGIPVWITFDVDVYGNYHLNVDAALHADWGFESKHTLQVGGLYEKETNSFTPITEYTPENTIFPLNLNGEINASARLELFPRVEIKLYSVFGPYAEIVPFVEGNYNAAIQSQITTTGSETFLAWNSGLDLGLDLRVGTELSVLGIEKEFGPIVVNCFEYPLWRSPSNIELLTTLPAEAESGSRHTLTLKIRDLLDNPVALCPVYIDGDGVFSRYLSLTDIYGEVTIDWTLGNETGEQSMTITIYDASKNVIDVLTHNITTTGPSLDLIAHYHLNGDASDASGNGHDGLVNGATPTIDRFGNENSAYSFDGIDDEIVIPNSPDFNLLDGFTFSAWINPKSWGESSMGFVLCRRVSHTSENGGYIFGFNPSEFSIHFIGVDGTIGAQVTDQLDETFFNSFHFVTATYNGEELKLYIDNELVGTETGIISMSPTDIDLVIGNTSAQDQARSFDGIIDDIRIYNYELSESDISTLYYEGGWEGPGDPETSTFVDVRDGQEYALVEIGNQTWMAENLNYISTNSFYYNNDPSYGEIYGRLYTFDDAINVCPSGWHLPTDDEWKVLETELGMPEEDLDILDVLMTDENWRGDIQGRMMKEGGSSGLNLNLGGYSHTSSFYSMNEYGRYWSSSEYGETEALNRFFWSDSDAVRRRHNPKDRLFSVRYVKD